MPIEPGPTDLQRFRDGDDGKPFVLGQWLRFAEGGRDRYLAYAASAQGILARIGATVLYAGEPSPPLLSQDRPWDALVLVRYPNRRAYADMLADPEYQALGQQRRAAIRDAVFLPMNDWAGR
jgi:uncharacterized protein (DUF1330 family)